MLHALIANLAAIAKENGLHNGMLTLEYEAFGASGNIHVRGTVRVGKARSPYRGLFVG